MKRVYESPVMMLEGFEANEYVATCYDITCLGIPDTDYYYPTDNGKAGTKFKPHQSDGEIFLNVKDYDYSFIEIGKINPGQGNSKNLKTPLEKFYTYNDHYNVKIDVSERVNAS